MRCYSQIRFFIDFLFKISQINDHTAIKHIFIMSFEEINGWELVYFGSNRDILGSLTLVYKNIK